MLRMEVQHLGIGVTTVYPGAVNTNISHNATIRQDTSTEQLLEEDEDDILAGNTAISFPPLELTRRVIITN